MELPPSLERESHCRGYYGSVSHNVKAIYQRYMGWFDGNPAHLWEHPPVERARRYVKAIGGIDPTLDRAREAAEAGDLRWAAELANHAVFAAPEHEGARGLQATVLERLGHGCENATWRNFFLMGAKELRDGIVDTPTVSASPEMVGQVPLEQILDGMAFRIDGPRAFGVELSIVFELSDTGEAHTLTLENAVLTHTPGKREDAQATLRLPRPALDELIAETVTTAELFEAGRIAIEGDGAKVGELFGLMDEPDPRFAIVTP